MGINGVWFNFYTFAGINHPWSGHHANLGTIALPWLTTDCVRSQFSVTIEKARAGYRRSR